MTDRILRARLVERRGELLAELFLQELEPEFLTRATSGDFAYDYLVGFTNAQKGINTFGVKLKATERPVPPRFQLDAGSFSRLTHSNIPVLLLVADVKRNDLYCAWLERSVQANQTGRTVAVPVVKVGDSVKRDLLKTLKSTRLAAAAVG